MEIASIFWSFIACKSYLTVVFARVHVCVCVDDIVVIIYTYIFSIKTRGVCVGDLSLKTRNAHFPFKHDKRMCDLRLPEKVALTVNID